MLFISPELLSSNQANLGNPEYHTYIPKLKKIIMDEYKVGSVVTAHTIQTENVFLFGSH